MTESYIQNNDGGQTFVGPDATMLYASMVLKNAIRLYIKTGMKMNRAYTPTAMRAATTRITGKAYKRTELVKAQADLQTWIDAMKTALPIG